MQNIFSFVVAENELAPTVYLASYLNEKLTIKKATQQWIASHLE